MACVIRLRADCLGGWSFLILGLAAFIFLPATLFTGLYLKYSASYLRVIGLSFFTLSCVMMAIGIGVCIVWMKYASPKGQKNPHSRPEYHPPKHPRPNAQDIVIRTDSQDHGSEEYELGNPTGKDSQSPIVGTQLVYTYRNTEASAAPASVI